MLEHSTFGGRQRFMGRGGGITLKYNTNSSKLRFSVIWNRVVITQNVIQY